MHSKAMPAHFCAGIAALLLLTFLTLDKGRAVHAFLDGRICLMRVDVDLIERAVILRAEIVRTLVNGAVDIRVLLIVHVDQSPFRMALFCLQSYDFRFLRDYAFLRTEI